MLADSVGNTLNFYTNTVLYGYCFSWYLLLMNQNNVFLFLEVVKDFIFL